MSEVNANNNKCKFARLDDGDPLKTWRNLARGGGREAHQGRDGGVAGSSSSGPWRRSREQQHDDGQTEKSRVKG